jgi:ribokinase
MVGVIVCTLGDLTLDVLVRLTRPMAADGDTEAEIVLVPGGQAANVAAWASALGATARFIGKHGADEPGRMARARLEAAGVHVFGPASGRTGVICSLVGPDGERSMAADRGAAVDLLPDELEPAWLEDCDHLFLSGYALLREPARSAAFRAAEIARGNGAVVSVDLSTWSAIRDAGAADFRGVVIALAPDVVFANEDEERMVGGMLPGITWILKRGPAGVWFDGDERVAAPAERVVDTTGAGDALAAGWIVGGPDLALESAARCVSRLGAMP